MPSNHLNQPSNDIPINMTFTKTTNKNNNNKEEEKLKEDKPVNFCVVEYYSYTFFFFFEKQTHTQGRGKVWTPCYGLLIYRWERIGEKYIDEKECNYYLNIYSDLLIIINKKNKGA